MSTLERAIAIAAEAHAGQVDKAGAPYGSRAATRQSLLGIKTRDYRSATLMAGSPRSADITSTVDGKALGAEGRLVTRLALAVFHAPARASKGCRIAPTFISQASCTRNRMYRSQLRYARGTAQFQLSLLPQ
jgi:hypothetical protein